MGERIKPNKSATKKEHTKEPKIRTILKNNTDHNEDSLGTISETEERKMLRRQELDNDLPLDYARVVDSWSAD
jgi:hypothetical protein